MDPRALTAAYYDLEPAFPSDVPFYVERLPGPGAGVLELGCGTGRVMVPLARHAGFIHGVDLSPEMVRRCQARLSGADVPEARALATVGDITRLRLDRTFDFIIAPYRVFQNLASDAEVAGFFATVRGHLAPGGRCILNTFRVRGTPAELVEKWTVPAEELEWEMAFAGGVLRCFGRRVGVTAEPLVLYPQLVYRLYRGSHLEDESVSSIAMRCWYPGELLERIGHEGFEITARWGGYAGEPWGSGPEQVVEFTAR